MTTPKYKDIVFSDYKIDKNGVITKNDGTALKTQKRISLQHSTGRKTVLMHKLMGYTFFNEYVENKSWFKFINGNDMDFRVENMKLIFIKPMLKKNGITIIKKDKYGNFIKKYKSIQDAARDNNIAQQSSITKSIYKNRMCKGFIFEYEGIPNIINNTKTINIETEQIIQKNENGDVIATFDTITDASKETKISSSIISQSLKNNNNSKSCGFLWERGEKQQITLKRPHRIKCPGDYDDNDFNDFEDEVIETISDFWTPLKYKGKIIDGSEISKNGTINGDYDLNTSIEDYIRWSFDIPFLSDDPEWFPLIVDGEIFTKYKISKCGQLWSNSRKNIMKQCDEGGYKKISLCNDNSKRSSYRIHRLMAYSFLGLKDVDKLVVNHKNGIKFDNRIENLEIVTSQENCIHGLYELKSRVCGKSKSVCKYNKNNKLITIFSSAKDAAENCGVHPNTMSNHLKKHAGKIYYGFIWRYQYEDVIHKKPDCEFKVLKKYPHYEIYEDGTIWSNYKRSNRPLAQQDKDGYKTVDLTENDGNYTCFVHRLVAKAFLENHENKKIVDHIDSNPNNNHVFNLRWSTQSDNMLHAHKNGNKKSETKPVYSVDKYNMLQEYPSQTQASKILGCKKQSISKALKNGTKSCDCLWFYDIFKDIN
jgi:hypothetical protein